MSFIQTGAENTDAAGTLRKHLNPALVGAAWDALIAAMAVGDQANIEAAQAAFDQLFTSSASGLYLERRAGDQGIQRPQNVGMPDDLFRQYAIRTSNNRLTEESLLEIMEVFYGPDSVRAHADTSLAEPYALSDQDDLTLVIDGNQTVLVVFTTDDFATPSAANAAEVAAAITRVLDLNGSEAYALPVIDPQTGSTQVRIFSGALGLGSSVQVTGGSAQPWLQFPSLVAAQVTPGPTWDLTYNAATSRLRFSPDANFDVSQVQIGDILTLYGSSFLSANRGSYEIVNVYWAYTGGVTLSQYFEVVNLDGVAQAGVVQLADQDLMVFRPVRQTTRAGREREVIVAVPGEEVDIVLPATSVAVGRAPYTAAYGQANTELTISSLKRVAGVVSVTTDDSHGLVVGNQVLIDGAYPSYELPPVTPKVDVRANGGTAAYSNASIWSPAIATPSQGGDLGMSLLLPNDRAILIGGRTAVAGVYTTSASGYTTRINSATPQAGGELLVDYDFVAATAIPVATLLAGFTLTLTDDLALLTGGSSTGAAFATARTFDCAAAAGAGSWTAVTSMNTARTAHAQTTIPSYGVLVTGGTSNATTGTTITSCEIYDQSADTWTAKASMAHARCQHAQILLPNGKVLVIGGRKITAGSVLTAYNGATDVILASCEVYDPAGNTWTSTGSMSMARVHHSALLLPNGKVLVVGGRGYDPTHEVASVAALSSCEIYDPATGRWAPAGSMADAYMAGQAAVLLPIKNQVLVVGGTSSHTNRLDLATMKWRSGPPAVATYQQDVVAVAMADDVVFLGGGYNGSGNTTTVAQLYIPNDDTIAAGGLNGQFMVATVPTDTTFTYLTNEQAYTLNAGTPVATPVGAAASTVPGPFSFDVLGGVAITGSESDLAEDLAEGHQYATIEVADATQFPDAPGWLVFAFGYENQVAPVRYLGRLSSTTLSLDYKFRFTANVPAGAKVCLLANKGSYTPTSPETVGSFYATASAAGRVAASAAVDEVVAGGIVVNKTIAYPGDRGLGGEGLPAEGTTKLSDKVAVWGSDDLDAEYAADREA